MRDIVVCEDQTGGTAILTTDSPQSHYGCPVLRIEAEDIDGDFGPRDLLGDPERGFVTAAEVVAGWIGRGDRNESEVEAARRFLQQWPEGPQV